jgi:pimeloyl-ACP methyl ester carboxylesterase
MATFLICHGAWSAGWAWKKVRPLLRTAGHEVFTPTYTDLGERAHHASPAVDLEMHIKDVLAVIEFEGLRDYILVGHSYGGMVATGVADRVPERVRHLIYLDAFVPENGQSLLDLRGPVPRPAAPPDEDWLVPPNPPPPDTSPSDLDWLAPRRRPQPFKTFSQSLQLRNPTPTFPRSYIYCTSKESDDVFLQFSRRFKSDPAWRYFEIAASHSPNVTAPEALVRLFCEIVR